jgi:hypothetical protein
MGTTYTIHSTTAAAAAKNILKWIAKTTLERIPSPTSSSRRFLKLIRANL